MYEGFSGIKDVKIYCKEQSFIDGFTNEILNETHANKNIAFINNLPRLWLEFICVFGLSLLIIIFFQKNSDPSKLVPVIGIFVVAAFRILPSINRTLSAIQNLMHGKVAFELLRKQFELYDENKLEKK